MSQAASNQDKPSLAALKDEPLLSELLSLLKTYIPEQELYLVIRAYNFGATAHRGQMRLSGEPYIHHPLSVARILAEMHLDAHTIAAAILHDVIEDTPTLKDQIDSAFGKEVAELVDGVSKLDQIHFASKAEAEAASFRKMILAMVKDIRVIMIKLADRLHNMRTLGAMPSARRRAIAHETLEIYALIAMRLGINSLRIELQDLGFKALYPLRYRVLQAQLKKARGNRKEVMDKVEITVKARMEEAGMNAVIKAREKTLHGVYNKMRKRHVRYHEIMDLFALRIVVDTVDQCYRALGVLHNLYKPMPGLFKDYIAIPKANGYQALHTTMFGPHGIPIEVQIRTQEMDRFAESGIAAHWLYKTGEKQESAQRSRMQQWLQNLLDIQQQAGNPAEFLENVKSDLFPDEVYVFTPQGQIIELPRGATPIDFAYAVHTDLGNACMSIKVDRRMAPLSTKLESGQTIEVITSSIAQPNPAWLNFVVTAKARAAIRHYLKHLTDEDAVRLGERLLGKALAPFEMAIDDVPKQTLKMILTEYQYKDIDELLREIGLGNRMPKLVARRMAPGEMQEQDVTTLAKPKPLAIKGTEGLAVSYARCCHPIPGDEILGFISAGKGIVIHRKNCKNIKEFRNQPEKWLDVEWSAEIDALFSVGLRIEMANRRGMLAQLAGIMSECDCNIESVNQDDKGDGTQTMNFILSVTNRKMLATVMRRIRNRKYVLKVNRIG